MLILTYSCACVSLPPPQEEEDLGTEETKESKIRKNYRAQVRMRNNKHN
jgi:hypothetical protein